MPIKVVIIDAYNTYLGFGCENAFNANPDKSYVAGIEGENSAYVDIALKKAMPLCTMFI